MNSAPPLFTGIVLLFVGAITAGRWWLVNDTPSDYLINRALTWDMSAVIGYGVVAALGYTDFAHRLFAATGLLAISSAFGFAVLLGGAAPRYTRARQRSYDTVAFGCAAFELALAFGDELGLCLHRFLDWEGALWSGTELFIAWVGLVLMRACVRELSASNLTQERLLYSLLCALGLYVFIAAVVSALRTAGGTSPRDPGTGWAIMDFLAVSILASLVSLPLFRALVARAEWDKTGRHCRRLRPLWHDLTAAVPEVVLPLEHAQRRGSDSELYRMTVEIGDALLHLKQFAADAETVPADTIDAYARRIAEAAELKRLGIRPAPRTRHPHTIIHPPADDRATELHNLLALSREWPRARAAATTAGSSSR
ncbi:MAB_1171c family putative transporter [Nocardia brasiliensis]|uniref:MAB_1171c family putative transporter n=1 Tax=Nocardia brasiliensis TaxID=37326 RepID=UPI001893EDFE|nr:MAB_1171c family putative transporter [Nocardia brasiliensis]MBF6125135.1 hypothetical protein [Nocardia brasiliensis]